MDTPPTSLKGNHKMADVLGTMTELEKHLEEMKTGGLITGYEVEMKDSDEDTVTWAVWTW